MNKTAPAAAALLHHLVNTSLDFNNFLAEMFLRKFGLKQ